MTTVPYDQLEQLKRPKVVNIHFNDLQEGLQESVRKVINELNESEPELINQVYQKNAGQTAVQDKVDEILNAGKIQTDLPYSQVKKHVMDELFGYGYMLQPLIDDPAITDIFVNNHNTVLVRKGGKDHLLPLQFDDPEKLEEFFRKIITRLGERANKFKPIVDTRDQERHLRINGAVNPIAKEPYFTIRKHQADTFNMAKLIEAGSLSQEMANDLQKYVGSWLNILVSGPTGSGKTTFMRATCEFIDPLERIVVLEEEEELMIKHQNIVPLETKKKSGEEDSPIEMDILVKNAMRMSPRRIILGELRHKESLELIRAFGTGHDGGLTSIHANGVKEALKQLAFLMLYADTPLKFEHLLSLIGDSVDLVVHVERHKVVEIAEVTGYDPITQELKVNPIWYFDVDPQTDNGVYRKNVESDQLIKKMALRRALRK